MQRWVRSWPLLIALAASSVTAQVTWTSNVLRSKVEKWEEPRRSRVIPFLDECRRAADSFTQLWLTGDRPAIFASLGPERVITRTDFDKLLDQRNAAFGVAQSVEYRSESLLLAAGDTPALLLHPYAEVDYAITTTKSSSDEYFFQLYLSRAGGSCGVITTKYQKYFGAVPPWLKRKQGKDGA